MNRTLTYVFAAVVVAWFCAFAEPALTIQDLLAETETALKLAYEQGVNLLSPRRVSKAEESLAEARRQIERGENEQLIRLNLDSALESLETALSSTEPARERLQTVLEARGQAALAGAEQRGLQLWQQAERGLHDLAASLESGRDAEVDGLREPLAQQYWAARREALRDSLIAPTKAEIAAAELVGADALFPTLLARARQALSRAEAHLAQEKLDECRIAALEALKHAKHAQGQTAYISGTRANGAQFEALLLPYDDLLEEFAIAWGESLDFSQGGGAAVEQMQAVLDRAAAKRDAQEDSILAVMQTSRESMEASLSEMQTRFADVQNEMIELDQRRLDMQAERDVAVSRLRKNELLAQRVQIAQTAFDPGDAVVYQTMDGNVVIHLYGLKFGSGQATLGKDQRSILKKAAEAIAVFPDVVVAVEGHTDDEGSEESNLDLSQQRADAVAQALESELTKPLVLSAVGKGEGNPIASNKTARGKALNRRIDLVLTLQ